MVVKWMKSGCWINANQSNRGKYRAVYSLYLPQKINSMWCYVSINIRQQEKGTMYCVVKCKVRGNQARVKDAYLCYPPYKVVMYRRKITSPVHNVLRRSKANEFSGPFVYLKYRFRYFVQVSFLDAQKVENEFVWLFDILNNHFIEIIKVAF
jgi:hypothetical protein